MFQSLAIANFQSHPDTRFELHPGINAIIGDSDKGKSAALRALFWASTNRPNGDAHVSDWCKTEKGTIKKGQECRVTLTTAKGRTCARIRSGELNGYEVDGVLCEAIRTDIPPEVVEFFNFSEVNIQRQADPPFLLSANAGEVARFFNRIIKLEEIDQVLSIAESRRRATKQAIETNTTEQEFAANSLALLGWLDELDAKVKAAQELAKELEISKARIAGIRSTIAEHAIHAAKLENRAAVAQAATLAQAARVLNLKTLESARNVNRITAELSGFNIEKVNARFSAGVLKAAPMVLNARYLLPFIETSRAKWAALKVEISSYANQKANIGDKAALSLAGEQAARARKLLARIATKVQTIEELRYQTNQMEQLGNAATNAYIAAADLRAQRPKVCPTCGKAWEVGHGE